MKCNLRLRSWFGDENTSATGQLTLDSVEHSLTISGSASERGWSGTIDGQEVNAADHPNIDAALTDVWCMVWRKIEELGGDGDDGWAAHVVDDQVVALVCDNEVLVGLLVNEFRVDRLRE